MLTAKVKVKEIWWEENDFHFIDENEKHTVLKNAYFSDYAMNFESNESVIAEKVDFTYDKIGVG